MNLYICSYIYLDRQRMGICVLTLDLLCSQRNLTIDKVGQLLLTNPSQRVGLCPMTLALWHFFGLSSLKSIKTFVSSYD